MKKTLISILAVVVVAVVGLLVVASTQPDTYHVERSVTLAAAPADAFPYANDYRNWSAWNPFRHADAAMKTETSENPVGVGAWTSWEGNNQVGTGKMTIVESTPDSKVVHRIDFMAPMEDQGTGTFSMVAEGEGTRFTWAMDGRMPLISKVVSLFGSMDAMIGSQFEIGLGELKALAEADATARIAAEQAAAAAAAAPADAAADQAAPPDGAVPPVAPTP